MYCSECGKEIANGSLACPYCGKEVETKEAIVEERKDNNRLANILCTISLCLLIVVPMLLFVISMIPRIINNSYKTSIPMAFLSFIVSKGIPYTISVLAAYVLMIISRVKCPNSKYAKVLMWIYIAIAVLILIIFIISIIACGASVVWCVNEMGKFGEAISG